MRSYINLMFMKKVLLIICVLLVIFNTLCVLLLSFYPWLNYGLVDFSIISSTLLIWLSINKTNPDAYRISLTFLFSVIGIVKITLSLFSNQSWTNNLWILAILILFIFEIILLFLIKYIRKHA